MRAEGPSQHNVQRRVIYQLGTHSNLRRLIMRRWVPPCKPVEKTALILQNCKVKPASTKQEFNGKASCE